MLTAGATQRNGQICLSLLLIAGEEESTKVDYFVEKHLGVGPFEHKLSNIRVNAGQALHLRHEIGVRKESEVKHQVSLGRHAVPVAEREDGNGGLILSSGGKAGLNQPLEVVHVELGSINDLIRELAEILERLALAVNSLQDADPGSQRMAPAGLRKPAGEDIVRCIQEQDIDLVARPPDFGNGPWSFVEENTFPGVHHQSQSWGFSTQADELGQLWKQQHGEIVDAEEPRVFQCPDGDRLARARHAGDDDDPFRRNAHSTSSPSVRRTPPSAMARFKLSANSFAEWWPCSLSR